MCHMVLYYNTSPPYRLSSVYIFALKIIFRVHEKRYTNRLYYYNKATSDGRAHSHVHLRRSLTKCMQHVIDSAIPNISLTSIGVKVGCQVTTRSPLPCQNQNQNQVLLAKKVCTNKEFDFAHRLSYGL